MTYKLVVLAVLLGTGGLWHSGCGSNHRPGPSGGAGETSAFAPEMGDADEKAADESAKDSTVDEERTGDETATTIAAALAGRWEARFAGSRAVIDLDTSSGQIRGSVQEEGEEAAPIEIGIVTADGFLLSTSGATSYIWIARLSGDVLSGRRERVDSGSVEQFSGQRLGNSPNL